MSDPIEQLRRLVEVRAKMIKARGEDATFDATMEGMSAIIRTDFPAILAAWEADRVRIDALDEELNRMRRNSSEDLFTMQEMEARIAKLEAVVEKVSPFMGEVELQNTKWGEQNHDPITWSAILNEECGEFAQSALHHKFGGNKAGELRAEAVQCAAVAMQIVWCIDRTALAALEGGQQ
jgi:hypothetical protein